jgi:hypothetical protein
MSNGVARVDIEQAAVDADWSYFKDKPVTSTLRCKCERWPYFTFRGHGKAISFDGSIRMVAMDPCPNCGKRGQIIGLSSDPEVWTTHGKG